MENVNWRIENNSFHFNVVHGLFAFLSFSGAFLFGIASDPFIMIGGILLHYLSYYASTQYTAIGKICIDLEELKASFGNKKWFMDVLMSLGMIGLTGMIFCFKKSVLNVALITINICLYYYTFYCMMRVIYCDSMLMYVKEMINKNAKFNIHDKVYLCIPETALDDAEDPEFIHKLKELEAEETCFEVHSYSVIRKDMVREAHDRILYIVVTDNIMVNDVPERFLKKAEE